MLTKARSPGRTVDVLATCQTKTLQGKPCSHTATTVLDGLSLCSQHAKSYRPPGIGFCSVLDARRRTLQVLHFSDLHGHRAATATAVAACEEVRNGAVVVITGDVGNYKRPRLDSRWSKITPSERWAVPGNHERDRKEVFREARGWVWSCPWIRVIGRFALIGFDSGLETKGVLREADIRLALEKLKQVWTHDDRRALVIASHHRPGGIAQAQIARGLKGIIRASTPVVLLYGHEHGPGSWAERPLGPFRSWSSRVSSCDREPIGHRITLDAGEPRMAEIR